MLLLIPLEPKPHILRIPGDSDKLSDEQVIEGQLEGGLIAVLIRPGDGDLTPLVLDLQLSFELDAPVRSRILGKGLPWQGFKQLEM